MLSVDNTCPCHLVLLALQSEMLPFQAEQPLWKIEGAWVNKIKNPRKNLSFLHDNHYQKAIYTWKNTLHYEWLWMPKNNKFNI